MVHKEPAEQVAPASGLHPVGSEPSGKATCPECGLPGEECNALTIGRIEAENWLRSHGYSGREAKETAYRLIPERRRAEPLPEPPR